MLFPNAKTVTMQRTYYFTLLLLAILSVVIVSFDKTPDYFIHEKLEFLWESKDDLRVPESVCYDDARNKIYVSNIDGKPSEKDGNGFISMLTTEGDIMNLKWVDGLDAPKGMGIHKGSLFVADIDNLRIIDLA